MFPDLAHLSWVGSVPSTDSARLIIAADLGGLDNRYRGFVRRVKELKTRA